MIQSNSREMWDLINVDDRERLTVDQLETGIATVTRSDDFFDCHPAVQTAFKFTKLVTNRGVTKSEKDQVAQIHRASKKNWVQRICIQLNCDIDCSIGWHKLHRQLKVL